MHPLNGSFLYKHIAPIPNLRDQNRYIIALISFYTKTFQLKFPTVGPSASSPYHPYKRTQHSPLNTGHGSLGADALTPGDKKSNVCSTCNTSFSQFSSLLRHIRQVLQSYPSRY